MADLRRIKTYDFDNVSGLRSFRILRPGYGMWHDVRRRLPYYWSDIKDGFNYRTAAGTVRIYFVNLLPAIAFLLDFSRRTDGFYGVNEALFSSALAALVFSTLSCQPLTIVGITGLIGLFNYTIFDIVARYNVNIYPQVMAWTGIWAAIFHWLFALFNTCDYMRYVTDFSSQSFGMYVGIIYCVKGVEELIAIFDGGLTDGYLSIVIAILFFGTVYALERVGQSTVLKPFVRGLLGDYAYPIATIFWTGFSHIPGRLKNAHLSDVPITRAFYPTEQRSWLIDFWNLDVKWIFVSLPFGLLTMLLFYYDHNVSSITAQARKFPLKKPGGFHWDFFLLGCTTFISGILGLPFPNGLVPQAPVHTDGLTVYSTGLTKLSAFDDSGDETELRHPEVVAEKVMEQRVSHFLMCLALVGTMTGPLLIVLHTIPRGLFAGVFFVVGWGSIQGNGITQKLVYLVSESRFVPRTEPLLGVRRRKILLYIGWQILGVAACVAISQTIAAIGFPVLIIALIPLRWVLFPKWFSVSELRAMDAMTADNEVVLASLGGAPDMAEGMGKATPDSDGSKEWEGGEEGARSTGRGEEDIDGRKKRGGEQLQYGGMA